MKKLVVTFLILNSVICILGAQVKTRVQDTLFLADGTKASGSLNIAWPPFVTADSFTVARSSLNVKIVNGNVTVELFPTEGTIPAGISYTVTYSLSNSPSYTEYWLVPLTGPVTIGQVRISPVPIPTTMFGEQQLTLGTGLQSLLGLWKRETSPVPTAEGQCYWDGLAHAIMCTDASLDFQPLAGGGGSTPDATVSIKGKVKLAGDLNGTADVPTVPDMVRLSGNQTVAGNKTFTDQVRAGGAAADPTLLSAFVAGKNWTDPDPSKSVVLADLESTTTYNVSTSLGAAGAMSDLVVNGSGGVGFVIGYGAYPSYSGSGLVDYLSGSDNFVTLGTGGSANQLVGVRGWVQSSGTVNTAAALQAFPTLKAAGTIENNYGLKVEDQTAGVNNWAIRTGLGKVELGGTLAAPDINGIRYADQFPGADIGARINAAIASLPSGYGGYKVGTVVLPESNNGAWSTTVTVNSPGISVIGAGPAASVFNCTINGDCLRIKTDPFTVSQAGEFRGFRINGNAGANAVGIHFGDIVGARLQDVVVYGFTGTNSSCIWLDNVTNWTERNHFSGVAADNCTKLFRFTVSGGNSSFAYNRFIDLRGNLYSGQKGLASENDAHIINSTITMLVNQNQASVTVVSVEGASSWSGNVYSIQAEDTFASGGGICIQTASGRTFHGTGYVKCDGMENSNAGFIQAVLTSFDDNGVVETPDALASRTTGGAMGSYLNPQTGAPGNFLQGLGLNLRWDAAGPQWVAQGDGTANGGAAVMASHGDGTIDFYSIPSTGGTTKNITPATLSSTHKKMTLNNAGDLQPVTGTIPGDNLPPVRNSANRNHPLNIGGSTATNASGYQGIAFTSLFAGGGLINETISLSSDGYAGIGHVNGTSISHPIAWGYGGDSIAFEWFTKSFETPIATGTRVAYLTGAGTLHTSNIQAGALSGAGTRFVKADNTGLLSAGTISESDVTNLTTDLAAKETAANKNQPSGYAGLDASSKLSAAQLPAPTATTLGGVKSLTCSGTDKLSAVGTDGVPVCSADQGGGGAAWGGITGTLSSQTDLQSALDARFVRATANTLTNASAPSTPAAGFTSVWTDTTDKTLKAKDDAGVVTTTVKPQTCSGTDKLSAIGAGGVAVCSTDETGGGGTWGSITGTLSSQTDLQSALDGKAALVTSGTAGAGPAYVGDASTAARSNHDHRAFASVTWHFSGTPTSGVQNLTLVLPEGIVNPAITDIRATVNTTSASSSTVNIQRCTASCTGTSPTFANIYASNLTLGANTRTASKGSAPDQNVSGLAAGDQFKANLVTVGASLADITITMTYKVNTTN